MNDPRPLAPRYDVVIVGGGLAGLTLARHLQLATGRTVLVLERRAVWPPAEQKYGEATVQLSAWYYAKVLDLEEHLLHDHLMKYNLRFYWKTAGRPNDALEDYAQGYYKTLSNIASYQIDRNAMEAELLALLRADPRVTTLHPVSGVAVDLAEPEPADGGAVERDHRVRFRDAAGVEREVAAGWVVDCSGRARLLAKKLGLARPNAIRHGAYFLWVEGNLDIERLTGRTLRQRRLARERSALGHLPFALATNHFCAEGLWFWVIPLRDDKTSLGLVFDRDRVAFDDVRSRERVIDWVCREFPLFARDLPQRRVLHDSGLLQFSHGCAQTISENRWALSGEAGRFLDPLYSPGGDFIAIHNTFIVDAIEARDVADRAERCRRAEGLMRASYESFVPSYATSYDNLGDAEAFSLKYVWELAVYFGFFVFPFMNELLTDHRGAITWVRRLAQLGPRNRNLQTFLRDFYHWRKDHLEPLTGPRFLDFGAVGPLARAADTFSRVGVDADEAREVLDGQLANLDELARFFVAHVASRVVGDPRVLHHRAFVAAIDTVAPVFDPEAMRARWREVEAIPGEHEWSFPADVLELFRTALRTASADVPEPTEAAAGAAMEASP